MRRRQRASNRSRRRPTALLRNSHQAAEPSSTPSTISAGEAAALAPMPPDIAPKIAMNEKIVAGLDIVSRKVPTKYCPRLRAGAAVAAVAAGGVRTSCHAIQSRKAPPKIASGARAATSASISQRTP